MIISQQMELETRQVLTQAQLQSLEILSMDSLELEAFLQEEYINNPLLEYTPEASSQDRVQVSAFEVDRSYRKKQNDGDEDVEDRLGMIAAADGDYLRHYLLEQLDLKNYSKREEELCSYLIGCLDDDGYFRMDPASVMDTTGCSREEIDKVLTDLRQLEPCGIFSQDLEHCLLRQLEEMGMDTSPVREMVLYHLWDIAEGKISTISRKLSITTAEVRRHILTIRSLNSKPLSGLRDASPIYIIPDVIYEYRDACWEIKIRDGGYDQYHLNDYYLKMVKESEDPELKKYFSEKMDRYRFVKTCIERRQKTMTLIAEAILKRQEELFSGKGKLKPMTITALADDIGMHQSTVGRAIKGKYIQSPAGTLLIKSLFSGKAASGKTEDGVTSVYIKEMIVSIIDEEDKKKPYSDAGIVRILAKHGINISRRAVAKYREELWIKSSIDRKER